jgi:hypothetical protein
VTGGLNARIEPVLRSLPVLQHRQATIESEALMLALDFCLMSMNELPRARRGGTRKAAKEVKKLATLAAALGMHILSMHRESLAAYEAQPGAPHPLTLLDDLRKMVEASDAACAHVTSSELHPAPRGAPKKHGVASLTEMAAEVYARLTGKSPTIIIDPKDNKARGPFLSFVRDLFDTLGLADSAEAQAKAAVVAFKERRAQKKVA